MACFAAGGLVLATVFVLAPVLATVLFLAAGFLFPVAIFYF